MALTKVTKSIKDALNVTFPMLWAKMATPPAAAADADTVMPAHALIDPASESLVPLPAALGAAGGLKIDPPRAATGTQSNVTGTNADTTILAANANRVGASVYNDSTAILYLLLATGTSSATVHSLQMQAGDYFEIPARYTGVVKGIWATSTGAARVTEFT